MDQKKLKVLSANPVKDLKTKADINPFLAC